jgi:formate hydrogenlyase subunit 4
VLGLVTFALHAGLMLVAAPLLACGLGALRARLAGRAGPPLLQPLRDLRRLARKQPVLPESAPAWLAIAPLVSVAAIGTAALLIPSFALGMATAPAADLIVIVGLLATARLVTAMAGLAAGASIGGIAAGRRMSLAVLTEPALLLVVFALAIIAGSTNVDTIAGTLRDTNAGLRVSLGLAVAAATIVGLVEAGRFQSRGSVLGLGQDTATLVFSGWHLATAEYASALLLVVWLSLLVVMFVPIGIAAADSGPVAWAIGILAWAAKLIALAVGLALFEAARPPLRWSDVPELLGAALLLALLAAVFLFVGQGLA